MRSSGFVYCPKCRKEYEAFTDDKTFLNCYTCHTPVIHQVDAKSKQNNNLHHQTDDKNAVAEAKPRRSNFLVLKLVLWIISSSVFFIACAATQQGANIRQWSSLSIDFFAMGVICSGIWLMLVNFR